MSRRAAAKHQLEIARQKEVEATARRKRAEARLAKIASEKMSEPQKALEDAINRAGNQSRLADLLGLSRQAVQRWNICPVRHALKVEGATGVSRHALRPDIYPRE